MSLISTNPSNTRAAECTKSRKGFFFKQGLAIAFTGLSFYSFAMDKVTTEEEISTIDPLVHYESNIEKLESDYGPYDAQLPQQLTSLGQHYRQQGLLDISRDALERAMHVSRISTGLYSLDQTPILHELAHTNTLRGDWESVDANQHYLYWIHKRNFGPDDPRMLPILHQLGRWHLQAYDEHNHKGAVEHLLRAHDFYKQSIEIVSNHYGELDPQLITHLRGYTATNYYLATHQVSIAQEVDDTGSPRKINMTNEDKRRLIQYISNSFRNGKKSIHRAIQIHHKTEGTSLQDKITDELAMADWNLLFGRWHTAVQMYKNIYSGLKQALAPGVDADAIFAKPVPLPHLPALNDLPRNNIESDHYILASFDVSPRGSARNIEFVEEFPKDNTQNRIRVRRALKSSKFRPRMEEGIPVITQRFTQKFIFPDQD